MQELRAAIEQRRRSFSGIPRERFAGRGIVTCAGGQRYFTCAWVLIWILRRVHQTQLPIQVWHLGRKEMSDAMRLLLEEQNVEVINAETVLHQYPARIAGGWPLKPYAIAQSRFREVIFLDADTVPFTDPAVMLGWDLYQDSGLLLWPDRLDLRATNPVWAFLGLEPRECVSADSGVLAVDKQRHLETLEIATLLNEHWPEVYQYLHGDKDTFLLAALLLNVQHSLIEARPFDVDGDMIQRDPHGHPFLHHRTCSKWKLFGSNPPVSAADLTAHCQEALEELRRRWTGFVFHPPDRSARAQAIEAELIKIGCFRYATGGDYRVIELLAAGSIGTGRSGLEQHWAVIERDEAVLIQFYFGWRLVVELTRQADGSWSGASLTSPSFEAQLMAEVEWKTHSTGKRVYRSAKSEVATLLDPALFAAGFDPKIEQELGSGLSLLNRLFDDVPEQIAENLATTPLPQAWHVALQALSQRLAETRDARARNAHQDLISPVVINPQHYTRIL
jgi:alpha 1,2-mannosyltransferase